LLQAYIDGFCSDARITQVEAHLDACDECRDRLEEARQAAMRASQLLGTLDPGPVHAPSFEELQARAAARAAGGEATSAARDEVDRAGVVTPSTSRVPFWRRPALAWAATVVIAFGFGWMSRTELGLLVEPSPPTGPAFEDFRAELPSADEADEAAVRRQEVVVGDEIDDVQAAQKSSASSEIVPQAAPPAPTVRQAEVQQEARAQISGDPATAGERRVADEEVAATPPARENAPAEGEVLSMELNEQLGRTDTFADVGLASGFMVVDRDSAELWLGVAPRELPDLALIRVEVGPGVLFDNGLPGRPAVRLVYLARSGQEISLLQQYAGSLEGAEQARLGALAEARPDAAAAPARAERSRSSGSGVDRKLVADRDAPVVGGTLDLPVTERLPNGTNVYRWMDPAGYLLSISGAIDPELLRGLADVIR
jgi:hypothetical protein